MIKQIKKLIPLRVKIGIAKQYENYRLNRRYRALRNEKKFYIIGSPNHGNLGDQAIIVAEEKFLKDNYPDYKIIDIDISEYYKHIKFIKRYIKDSEIIFLHGGGNFGNQYLFDENIRRDFVESFPNNKLILFPQTIYFTDDGEGKKELEKSKNIYNKHKDLTLVAREKVSYDLMKKHFPNNKVLLTPDIVLYLNESKEGIKRSGALFCMRSDVESKFSSNEKDDILGTLKKEYKDVTVTDTVIGRNINKEERSSVLKSKFDEFRRAEIVITDRIHGMIFAAITGTPCIALSNYNQKVKGTYQWIKDLDYIKFAESQKEISKYLKELKDNRTFKYNNYYSEYEEIFKM